MPFDSNKKNNKSGSCQKTDHENINEGLDLPRLVANICLLMIGAELQTTPDEGNEEQTSSPKLNLNS
jgi:hypothetical protein